MQCDVLMEMGSCIDNTVTKVSFTLYSKLGLGWGIYQVVGF